MAPQEYAALAAKVNALDRETALRVARLVLECRSSLELALVAVQEADRTAARHGEAHPQPRPRGKLAATLARVEHFGDLAQNRVEQAERPHDEAGHGLDAWCAAGFGEH